MAGILGVSAPWLLHGVFTVVVCDKEPGGHACRELKANS
jgi:hypothetical protein